MALPSSLLLSLQIFLFLACRTRSERILLTSCGTTNYTAGTPYESNLRRLLTKLVDSTWNSSSFNSIATMGSSPNDQVFGLAQCRPDVSASTCFDCLNSSSAASSNPNGGCPLSKSAALRADDCVLRYSDQSFFSIRDMSLFVYMIYHEKNSNPVVFNKTVHDLMDEILPEASEVDSRFGAGQTNYSDLRDIYGMAWCTQDLSGSDCLQCLDEVAGKLRVDRVASQVMTVSCIARFQTSSFLSVLPPPPPPLQQSESSPLTSEGALAAVEGGNSANGKEDQSKGKSSKTVKMILIIVLPIAFALAALCVFLLLQLRNNRTLKTQPTGNLVPNEKNKSNTESLLFDLDTIIKATNNFSEENKLGEGGFGPVYKGLLEDGQQFAVKRLSRTSRQGFVEMKNEVALVAKLQHKNLVKLLGCCLEENEMMLIYEYLPKTSLEKYLFDPTERRRLDWRTRYKIIEGIARGLLYLHEESRLKIIHRDLKASNILLDNNMTPKISDFGLARLFHIDQTQTNTNRIAGTLGYMAPEYALLGLLSTKSDVFSYGVLILEIITGRRNGASTNLGHPLDLLSYVWKFWNQLMPLQVVDECLGHEYHSQEALKCVHVGLLCVQEDSLLRPSMASVMLMISSVSTTFPAPSMPPFYVEDSSHADSESFEPELEQDVSMNGRFRAEPVNSVTTTDLEAR